MSNLQSEYERIMIEKMKNVDIYHFTEEENLKILKGLSESNEDYKTNGIQDGNIFPSENDQYLK